MQRSMTRFAAALQSEQPVSHWSKKVVRKPLASTFYAHPTYVLAREKLLSNMWKEHLVFKVSVYTLTPFFLLGWILEA